MQRIWPGVSLPGTHAATQIFPVLQYNGVTDID